MRATQETSPEALPSKAFAPVHLILESQEEVNKVYALLYHHELREAVGLKDSWMTLTRFSKKTHLVWLYAIYIWANKVQKKALIDIVVEVYRGCVSNVFCSDKKAKVIINDLDSLDNEPKREIGPNSSLNLSKVY